MADEKGNPTKNSGPGDIVFDCPHCGKNLAIDARGAGLGIPCPACGRDIEVPIPEGVDITDIDRLGPMDTREPANGEEPARLPESPDEIRVMQTELEELRFRRRDFDKRQAAAAKELLALQQQVSDLRTALEQIEDTLKRLQAPASGDTQTLG